MIDGNFQLPDNFLNLISGYTGGQSRQMPTGSKSMNINPNMAPPQNFWDGDNFRIGAPGLQSVPAGQGVPQSAPQTPQPMGMSKMPASFAAPMGAPAMGGMGMPQNAAIGGSTASGPQLTAQIGRQLMPKFDMQGMGSNPFLGGYKNSNFRM